MANYTIAQIQQNPAIIDTLEDVDMERIITDEGLEYHEINYQDYSQSLRDSLRIAAIDPSDRSTYEEWIEYETYHEYGYISYNLVQLPSNYALYVVYTEDFEEFVSEKYSTESEAHDAIQNAYSDFYVD